MSLHFHKVNAEFSTIKSCILLFFECWNIKNGRKTLRLKRAGHRMGKNWSGWKLKIIWIWVGGKSGFQKALQAYMMLGIRSETTCLLTGVVEKFLNMYTDFQHNRSSEWSSELLQPKHDSKLQYLIRSDFLGLPPPQRSISDFFFTKHLKLIICN